MKKLNLNLQEWHWPEWALLFLAILIALGQFQRVTLPGTSYSFYAFDVLLMAWCGFYYWKFPPKLTILQLKNTAKPTLFWALILSIAGGWLAAALRHQINLTTFLYAARYFLYGVWGLSLYQLSKSHRLSPFHRQHWLPLLTGLLIAWFGMFQYIFLPDTRFLAIFGWDDHLGRLISTPFDPGFTGFLLVVTLLTTWRVKLPQLWKWILSILLLIAIGLTYSRASYLSLGVGVVVYWWSSFGKSQALPRLSLNAMLLAIIGVVFISSLFFVRPYLGEGTLLTRTSTITARIKNSTDELNSLQPTEWIWGRGLFVFRPATQGLATPNQQVPDHSRFPDNSLVWLITQLGVVGTGLVFCLAVYEMWQWRQHPLLLSVLAALVIHSFFAATLTYSLSLVLLIWIIALETATAN